MPNLPHASLFAPPFTTALMQLDTELKSKAVLRADPERVLKGLRAA
jgi:hypothetical protein